MGLGRRVGKLEKRFRPERVDFAAWPLDDQIEDVLDTLRFCLAHYSGGSRYPATDREVSLLAALYARERLPEGEGKYEFPSGTLVRWVEHEDGTPSVSWSGSVSVEDLPEHVGRVFERMDPAEQPARERFLFGYRHKARSERERMRRWREQRASEEAG